MKRKSNDNNVVTKSPSKSNQGRGNHYYAHVVIVPNGESIFVLEVFATEEEAKKCIADKRALLAITPKEKKPAWDMKYPSILRYKIDFPLKGKIGIVIKTFQLWINVVAIEQIPSLEGAHQKFIDETVNVIRSRALEEYRSIDGVKKSIKEKEKEFNEDVKFIEWYGWKE